MYKVYACSSTGGVLQDQHEWESQETNKRILL